MEGTLSLFDWRPGSLIDPGPGHVPGPGAGTSAPKSPKLPKSPRAAKGAGAAGDPGPRRAPSASNGNDVRPAEAVPEARSEVQPIAEPTAAMVGTALLAQGSGPTAVVAGRPEPRIVIFDCETTGTDRVHDQVIELCIQRGLQDDAPSQTWRIKPTAPIHPGAQAVHGITLADLEGCPAFAEVAPAITAVFAEAEVVVGYNIAFDIDMLQAEYTRIGQPLLDLSGKQIVDAFRLWQQCEPRSLQHAHQRFVGNGFASAHSASADVAATGRVLSGMLRAFDLASHDWEAIACKCDPQYAARASWVGPSRHLRWESDVVVLGFGKHANAALHQLAAGPDRGFLRWVVDRDFPVHVSEVCRAALELAGDEFLAWARRRYPVAAPRPPATPAVEPI